MFIHSSPASPECVHCSSPALSLLTGRPTPDAQLSPSLVAPTPAPWFSALYLTTKPLCLCSHLTSGVLLGVLVFSSAPLPGQERGLHTAVVHLLHPVQHIAKLQEGTHSIRLSIHMSSSFQGSKKSLLLYSPFTNTKHSHLFLYSSDFLWEWRKKKISLLFPSFYQFLPANAAP